MHSRSLALHYVTRRPHETDAPCRGCDGPLRNVFDSTLSDVRTSRLDHKRYIPGTIIPLVRPPRVGLARGLNTTNSGFGDLTDCNHVGLDDFEN